MSHLGNKAGHLILLPEIMNTAHLPKPSSAGASPPVSMWKGHHTQSANGDVYNVRLPQIGGRCAWWERMNGNTKGRKWIRHLSASTIPIPTLSAPTLTKSTTITSTTQHQLFKITFN